MTRTSKVTLIRRLGQVIRVTQTGNASVPATAVTVVASGTNSCFIGNVLADNMTNTVQFGNSFQFKLSSVIDSNEFTSLFDRYKIAAVKLRIMYQADSASVGGAGILPVITYSPDMTDAIAPSSYPEIATKAAAKSTILNADRPINILLRPRALQQLDNSAGGVSGLGVTKSMYITSTYPDAVHYGFKFWVQNFYAPTGANNQIQIQPTYYLALKDPQ